VTQTSLIARLSLFARTWSWPLAAAALVTALYLLPQIVYSLSGHEGALLVTEDEGFYLTRMVRGLQGQPTMSPLIYEHRNDLSLVTGTAEGLMALPFRLGIAAGARPMAVATVMVVVWRVVLTFIAVLMFVWALRSSGLTLALSTIAALLVFLDPGVMAFKPIVGFRFVSFVFNRLTNPLLGFPIYCLAWGSLARAMVHAERRLTWAAVAGVATGLCFYINFFYWTFLFGVVGVTTLIDLRERWRVALVFGVVTAIVGVGYLPHAFAFRGHEQYYDILWRTDFRQLIRGVAFVPNRTSWAFFLGALALWKVVATPAARYFASAVAAGLVVKHSGLFTGLQMPSSLESGHWDYALTPLVMVGCLWCAQAGLQASRWAAHEKNLHIALAVLLVAIGTVNFARLSKDLLRLQPHGSGVLAAEYAPAWRWLDEHTPSEVVVLASEETQAYEVLKAGKYIWGHFRAYPDPVSFEEMLDRYLVLWKLSGWTPDELARYFESFYSGPGTWLWGWGLTKELADQLRQDDWPQLERMRWRAFTKTITELLGNTRMQDLKAIGSRYRVDYIVRGPNETRWTSADEVFELERVFEAPGVTVDRVLRWR
jgi:hypothetical protein